MEATKSPIPTKANFVLSTAQAKNDAAKIMKTEEPTLRGAKTIPMAAMQAIKIKFHGLPTQKIRKYMTRKTTIAEIVIIQSCLVVCGSSTGWNRKKARNMSQT